MVTGILPEQVVEAPGGKYHGENGTWEDEFLSGALIRQVMRMRRRLASLVLGTLVTGLFVVAGIAHPVCAAEKFTHNINIRVMGFYSFQGDMQAFWGSTAPKYNTFGTTGNEPFTLHPDFSFKREFGYNNSHHTLVGSFSPDMSSIAELRYSMTNEDPSTQYKVKLDLHLVNVPRTEISPPTMEERYFRYLIIGDTQENRDLIARIVKEVVWDCSNRGARVFCNGADWNRFVDRPEIYTKPTGPMALFENYQLPAIDILVHEYATPRSPQVVGPKPPKKKTTTKKSKSKK